MFSGERRWAGRDGRLDGIGIHQGLPVTGARGHPAGEKYDEDQASRDATLAGTYDHRYSL